jgi:HEAT repeat protein
LEVSVLAYVEELVKALRHEDPEIRMRVANALKELEDPRATMPLMEALDYEENEDVRGSVAWTLQWVADERAQPMMIEMLGDRNDSVRLWAACGLERLGDGSAVEALIEALKDNYDAVRLNSIYALGRIGDRRAVEPLKEALNDGDAFVRCEANTVLREDFGVYVDCNT